LVLEVVGEVGVVVGEGVFETLAEGCGGVPAEGAADVGVVAVVVADVYAFAVWGEGAEGIGAGALVGSDEEVGEVLEADDGIAAEIEDVAVGFVVDGGEAEGVDGIVYVGKVAELLAAPNVEGMSLDEEAYPDTEEGLAGIADAHAGAVGVGEAEGGGANIVDVVVEDVVPFAGHFVDAVDINGAEEVVFVYGEVVWFAIDLACAGEDDFDGGVVFAACFEDGKLGAAIDVEIGDGVVHGVEVARLAGKVEEVVLILDEVAHAMFVADIGDVDTDGGIEAMDIEEVAAVFRDETINEEDIGAEGDEVMGKIGADKTQAAGNEHVFVGKHGRVCYLSCA
jgi:hypothetical protein